MKNTKRKVLIIVSSILVAMLLSVAVPFIILGARTSYINNKYSDLKENEEYAHNVEVKDVELVTQHISCGYATIEMMSEYYGDKVTEDELSEKNNGNISTSSSLGFLNEINDSIPNKTFIKKSYLRNDDFLTEIHQSLENSNPVAIEWAAKYEEEWTLHFSLVTGLDLQNDVVTVYNPYGYIETINTKEFISRTSFSAYENMPLFLDFGFAFGAFEKNTIFFAE